VQDPSEFRVDLGDVELAVYSWPGAGDPVLLLHATGFHSRCWNEVVRLLPGRQVYAADLRFHGASSAAGEVGWGLMARDVQRLIERLDLPAIVGVGHSIGGYLLARAAARAPARFCQLVLIDPVIMAPERYALFREGPQPRGEDHPVSRRKNRWRGAQEMYERFRERAPFDSWHPAVLRDYCDHALRPAENAQAMRRLACDPLDEARIYLRQRGNEVVLAELPDITTPVTLLRARPSATDMFSLQDSPTWPGLAAALPHCREVYLPHLNHFIPMQDPELVARHILAAQ